MTTHRVLYLLRYFPTLTETFVYEEIKALKARRHHISIASMGRREDGKISDGLPTVEVLSIPRRPLKGRWREPGAGAHWLRQHQRPKDIVRFSWLVQNIRHRFDHIHVHFAGEAAELAHAIFLEIGVPYTVMVHATDLFRPRPSMHQVLSNAHKVLTICTHHQEYLADLGIRASVVRCGPDLKRWEPFPLPTDSLHALTVARDVPKKGLDDLLTAWEQVSPPSQLTLVSDIQRSTYPMGVEVVGLQPPSEIRRLMQTCNLHFALSSSPRWRHGWCCMPHGSHGLGSPCPPTGLGYSQWSTKVGWMVPPNRPDLLQSDRFSPDPAQRLLRGQQGRHRLVERGFTLQSQVNGLLESWQKP